VNIYQAVVFILSSPLRVVTLYVITVEPRQLYRLNRSELLSLNLPLSEAYLL